MGLPQEDLSPAGGLPGAVERLRAAAAARAGTGEDLVLLLVALLRALGLQARSVRCVAAEMCRTHVLIPASRGIRLTGYMITCVVGLAAHCRAWFGK